MFMMKTGSETSLRRYDAVIDETIGNGRPNLRPATVRWNKIVGQSSLTSYVQPHLPYTSGICAYYEQDCFNTRYFTADTGAGSISYNGVFVDSNASGMSVLTNPPQMCMSSLDLSTTKIKGYCYDTWDSKLHRTTTHLNGSGGSIIYGLLLDQVPFSISRCAIVATKNLIPRRFITMRGFSSSAAPTICTYQDILADYSKVRYLGQKTYNSNTFNIYIISEPSEGVDRGNYYYFLCNPCIGLNMIDESVDYVEAHIIYAATELNVYSS